MINDLEAVRKSELKELEQNTPNLYEQFNPGTVGFHELRDRVSIILANWDNYVMGHASCLMDKERYEQADKILSSIYDFYNSLSGDVLSFDPELKVFNDESIDSEE